MFQAIKTAAARTGVDFSYLLKKASQESGFDANAKASTSSATGLYQFTSQTWLQMIKTHGAQYGLGTYADQISTNASGTLSVSNPAVRQAILNLRKDPTISAEMAGELDKENLGSLKQNVGGKINGTDLYLAHFLGAGGATDFLNKMKLTPNAKAADVLPTAASANPTVFYNDDGSARSLTQIYHHFAQKFDSTSSSTLVASAQTPGSTNQSTMPVWSNAYVTAGNIPNSSSVANYSTPVLNSLSSSQTPQAASTSQSLFATMVLAQAQQNSGDIASSLLLSRSHMDEQDKKKDGSPSGYTDAISIG